MRRSNARPARALVVATAMLAQATMLHASTGIERIPPDQGGITLTVDGAVAEPQSYMRRIGDSSQCEMASWDEAAFFGQATHCRTIGERYWRSGLAAIDLLFEEFVVLGDFVLVPPRLRITIPTGIGEIELYGFDVDAMTEEGSQCIGFVHGYGDAGDGFREIVIAYACADPGPLSDERIEALLRGFAVAGAFDGLLP